MKIIFKKFAAAILLFVVVAGPIRAQNDSMPAEATNAITATNFGAGASMVNDPNSANVKTRGKFEDGDGAAALTMLVPIVAIVMGCSIPIVIVGLQLYFRHRKNIMLHETLRTMVEKGVPIPPEMFKKTEHEFMEHDKSTDKRPRNDLRNGLIFIGIGIGVVMLTGKAGYIILFLGVAFVVASFLEKKDKNDAPPPKQ